MARRKKGSWLVSFLLTLGGFIIVVALWNLVSEYSAWWMLGLGLAIVFIIGILKRETLRESVLWFGKKL